LPKFSCRSWDAFANPDEALIYCSGSTDATIFMGILKYISETKINYLIAIYDKWWEKDAQWVLKTWVCFIWGLTIQWNYLVILQCKCLEVIGEVKNIHISVAVVNLSVIIAAVAMAMTALRSTE
jgi:hypothetical protein